ncbi:Oxoglutarate/iron-dependent dioxygenase [Penicillium angulare]|uniref:Oxoglutarate/iron-dependent dioxygenase n=1 Tax=Penicillium angulare TaxID=116970 RepID=UPI00253F77D8|nr:Oxoglutarate/iron-dependent dioxygenase [Penicillium angulare]KAJ5278974.1 Oxoglutarate/iron-dependent dioxygenase [Penicillium angulare]
MSYDLDGARIAPLSGDAFYISDFVSEDEEAWLMHKVQSAPLPRWTHLSHRRLQTWPSALTKTNTLLSSPLPSWLTDPIISPRFKELGIFANAPHSTPNHVLVNEYQPGQGIMPHEDGAAYYPLVATVSLGAPIVLDIYEKNPREGAEETDGVMDFHGRPRFRILQERRSLLIMRGKLYTDSLHGIAESTRDEDLGPHSICNWDLLREKAPYEGGWVMRETRTSLTYRDVLKVAKMGNTLKFLGGTK